jgi:Protein of unknown function (DUF1524)
MRSSTGSSKSFSISAWVSALLVLISIANGSSAQAVALHTTAPKASSLLSKLPIRSSSSMAGYARRNFSDGWGNIGNCDLRNYILIRDLTQITYRKSPACTVATGTLHDPYTGSIIHFVRGVSTSSAVQIDHVVALGNAWQTGAKGLAASTRYNLANDPLELLAVDGPTNESKGDADAANWLPRQGYQCAYVARQIAVKYKYHLWVTRAEHDAMVGVLVSCPNQTVPTS